MLFSIFFFNSVDNIQSQSPGRVQLYSARTRKFCLKSIRNPTHINPNTLTQFNHGSGYVWSKSGNPTNAGLYTEVLDFHGRPEGSILNNPILQYKSLSVHHLNLQTFAPFLSSCLMPNLVKKQSGLFLNRLSKAFFQDSQVNEFHLEEFLLFVTGREPLAGLLSLYAFIHSKH